MIWYGLHTDRLIIRFNNTVEKAQSVYVCKKVTLFFFVKNEYQKEVVDLSCKEHDLAELFIQVACAWAEVRSLEKYSARPCFVEAATFDFATKTAYISFDIAPMISSGSVYHKYCDVMAFLKTIKENCPFVERVYFLQNGKTLCDPHLDFSLPWPVNGFIAM